MATPISSKPAGDTPSRDFLPAHIRPSIRSLDSPSSSSARSVDSVPVTGMYPLGSLRVTEAAEAEDEGSGLLGGGDVLILDDLPPNFTVGCDSVSFNTKQQFFGFRDIPAGAHLIWVSSSEATSTRSAYWIFTPEEARSCPGKVYIKQWDKFNEVLTDPASRAEERFQKEGLAQTFADLTPYPSNNVTDSAVLRTPQSTKTGGTPAELRGDTSLWSQLTFAIDPALLTRITGKAQDTWPVSTLHHVAGDDSMPEETRLYPVSSPELTFTFPKDSRLIDPEAEGAERTRQALDPSSYIISRTPRPQHLIGELQFAFLVGMHLGNYSCLEQWWDYVNRLIFRAHALAAEKPELTVGLIQTFHNQLVYNDRHLESSVLDTMPSHARKLKKTLTTYKTRLNESLQPAADGSVRPDRTAVAQAFASLETWLGQLGWDLAADYVRSGNVMLEDGEIVAAELSDFESEDERGEFAAVVVDLDEDGRPRDLVSV